MYQFQVHVNAVDTRITEIEFIATHELQRSMPHHTEKLDVMPLTGMVPMNNNLNKGAAELRYT
jgi:hypothetical protein